MRFRLRTALIVFTLCAVGGAWLHYSLDFPAVQAISMREEWDNVLPRGKCVVFVLGDWNPESHHMRRELEAFTNWAKRRRVRVLSLTIDPNDDQNDVWKISAEISQNNGLHPGNMKNMNGAGRVLWFKNAKLVDHAWGPRDLAELDSNVSYLQFLKERTEKAFR
jgi:hypothetical protein